MPLPFEQAVRGLIREGESAARSAASSLGGGLAEARSQAESIIGQVPAAYRSRTEDITEARKPATPANNIPAKLPERAGWVNDIPEGGLNDVNASMGASTSTDRRSSLREMWEAYLSCPWSWACVTAISRTVTAGGLVVDWDGDDGEGDKEAPDKPAEVLALENLIKFCNPTSDIRQLLRNVIADLQVFGDAFLEVTWWGKIPVALYNLDCPTTTPLADEHGVISGYVQVTDSGKRAEFKPHEVIHISLDAARPGVFGVSPTQAAMLPITAWLFAAALAKEMMRKGLPPSVHVDMPANTSQPEMRKWKDGYLAGNIGIKNIGSPVVSKGGAHLGEMQSGKVADVMASKNQSRDECVSCYGVPPSKVGIIESGNLGGGTGEAQDRTYRIDTCGPVAELVIEKIQFAIAVNGFGVKDWHLKFPSLDYQDSQIIEDIRDQRLRNGSWTLNRYRAEIGEAPVDGGDDAVIVDRQNMVLWADMNAMSKANIAGKGAAAVAAGETPPGGEQLAGSKDGKSDDDEPPPASNGKAPANGKAPPAKPTANGKPKPAESLRAIQMALYERRLREALKRLPVTETTAPSAEVTGQAVYDQLARDFPPDAIRWVKDADWHGPVNVGASQIDTANRDKWAASTDGRLPSFAAKLRRRMAAGLHLKPAVLVRHPGSTKDAIADGHHRALASIDEGQPVWAYVGHVASDDTGWQELHDRQYPDHVHPDGNTEEAPWPVKTAVEVSGLKHQTAPAGSTLSVP